MKGLYVNHKLVETSQFMDFGAFKQDVLQQWHRQKPRILCACQKHDPRAEMHVRLTRSGAYTLANNPEHSDKHTRVCPFYGEVVRSPPSLQQAMVREGEMLIAQLRLFSGTCDGEEDPIMQHDGGDERFQLPAFPSQGKQFQRTTCSFPDFVYGWYCMASERLLGEGKQASRVAVLYHMWVCLVKHLIVVGAEDFYYHAYVPNERFIPSKGRRVVIGYVANVEKVLGGERWTIIGLKESRMYVLVCDKHLPKYSVLNKLAALRIDFASEEPITVSRAMAWRITREGWWLFSDAEWKLLRELQRHKIRVERPRPQEAPFGYASDFILREVHPPVLVDVLDPPDEKQHEPRQRIHHEELYLASRQIGAVQYMPWRSGDLIDFDYLRGGGDA